MIIGLAGNLGLILGCKVFQRLFAKGTELLNATEEVYLDEDNYDYLK